MLYTIRQWAAIAFLMASKRNVIPSEKFPLPLSCEYAERASCFSLAFAIPFYICGRWSSPILHIFQFSSSYTEYFRCRCLFCYRWATVARCVACRSNKGEKKAKLSYATVRPIHVVALYCHFSYNETLERHVLHSSFLSTLFADISTMNTHIVLLAHNIHCTPPICHWVGKYGWSYAFYSLPTNMMTLDEHSKKQSRNNRRTA